MMSFDVSYNSCCFIQRSSRLAILVAAASLAACTDGFRHGVVVSPSVRGRLSVSGVKNLTGVKTAEHERGFQVANERVIQPDVSRLPLGFWCLCGGLIVLIVCSIVFWFVKRDAVADSSTSTSARAIYVAYMVYVIAIGEGYDFAVFSTVLVRLQEVFGVDKSILGLLAACHYLGMIVGAPISGPLSDFCGRKKALSVTCGFLVVGCLIMGFAPNVGLIVVGRGVMGVGFGLGIPLGALYIVETAPADKRGSLGAGFGAMLSLGAALGGLGGALLLDTWQDWRVMILLGCILPTFPMILLFFRWFPESPRWLAKHGDRDGAVLALEQLNGCSREAAEQTFRAIEEQNRAEKASNGFAEDFQKLLCPSPEHRPRVVAGLGTLMVMFCCGALVLVIYLPLLLRRDLGRRVAVLVSGMIISLTAIATLFFTRLPDVCGRRPLLVFSYALIAVMYLMLCWGASPLSIVEAGQPRGWWMAYFITIGACAFQIALAPVTLFYAGEILPSELRAMGLGFGTMLSRIIAFLVTFFVPIMLAANTWVTYLTFGTISFLIVCFILVYAVETKGVDLEKMDEVFKSGKI
eukprot:gnl/TRDRNA2_/TRDRNA2_43750_c0_seq1.p1 gnl/TRDRNA2_/TRDRNA2_43750_c0~~gnl/TRDRNA2_/TRDRNA2_43750_c0_seq1.p1  ORF type:complete len:578 (-),score=58.50 gnl/TRDRNA2_/TRDRNA2_43750_c0_seq1:29-1762(-)